MDIKVRAVMPKQHYMSHGNRAFSLTVTPDSQPMLILEVPEPIGSHMTTLPSAHLSFARQLGLEF